MQKALLQFINAIIPARYGPPDVGSGGRASSFWNVQLWHERRWRMKPKEKIRAPRRQEPMIKSKQTTHLYVGLYVCQSLSSHFQLRVILGDNFEACTVAGFGKQNRRWKEFGMHASTSKSLTKARISPQRKSAEKGAKAALIVIAPSFQLDLLSNL